ncbi:hypothetical protein ILP97_05095 [Amycolatopsis sp. H6(2020)]|nr:hypothetical protein [Amycolatopsis sp. H6(2020)]
MPLALLLQKLTAGLTAAAKALAPWQRIVSDESTVVERARGAFLTHWFGPGLPFEGLSLRARIVNLGALDAQFQSAQRSVPTPRGGPNLTAPVLGFAGTLAGVMLSPAGGIIGGIELLRLSEFSIGTLLKAIVWMLAPFALGVGLIRAPAGTSILVGGALGAAGLGFALAAALGNRREIRAVVDLFGSLARFMNAGVLFLDRLLGPRAAVRNPLLARLLKVADRGAAMFAQLLGALAVLMTRVAPVLPSVVETALGIRALAGSVGTAIGEVVADLLARLEEMRGGQLAIAPLLGRIAAMAKVQLRRVVAAIVVEVGLLAAALADLGAALGKTFDTFLDKLGQFLKDLFVKHPVALVFDALHKQVAATITAFKAPPPATAGKKKEEPSALKPLIDALPSFPKIRDFPDLPKLPDTAALRLRLRAASVSPLTLRSVTDAADRLALASGPAAPIELGPASRAAIAATAHRPSIFAKERFDAELLFGARLPAALRVNQRELAEFRTTIGVVVGRVLPPALRAVLAPRAAELFAKVDQIVYGDPERKVTSSALPVLTPSSPRPVRPVVTKLRLRMPGASLGEVRRFQATLAAKLAARTFAVDGGR